MANSAFVSWLSETMETLKLTQESMGNKVRGNVAIEVPATSKALVVEIFPTPEMIDAFLAAMVPGGENAPDLGLAAALQRDLDDNTAKLADLAVGLEGVRLASPAAMEAILAELRRTGQASDRLRTRIADLERQRRAGPDLEAARASMLRFVTDPATFDLPRDQLRLVLQAIPALFIAKGKLVEPVEKWRDAI